MNISIIVMVLRAGGLRKLRDTPVSVRIRTTKTGSQLLYICIYVYVYMYVYLYGMYIYIYIYIHILYIYIYIYTRVYMGIYLGSEFCPSHYKTCWSSWLSALPQCLRRGQLRYPLATHPLTTSFGRFKKTSLSSEPLPCKPAAETAVQPLIR